MAEAAEESRRHPVTIRKALEDGALHGAQRVQGGRWLIEETCLRSWMAGSKCAHRQNVTTLQRLEPQRRSA